MAGASESNDASDIFWPGYVDAISNLAINLLFVIAVMCIVILSFVLEETTKGHPQEGTVAAQAAQPSPSQASSSLSEAQVKALQEENNQLKQQLQAMKKESSSSQATAAAGQSDDSPAKNTRMEVVNARQEVVKDAKGPSQINSASAGLIVNFDPKVVTLSAEEGKDVYARMQAYGAPASTRWQITVISPKGFSEAARLAYYRAVAVRNVMIQNGVPGEMINLRVLESAQAGADHSRVTVHPLP